MEKKTREHKVPISWETKTKDYWIIQNRSGWIVEYPTEIRAAKAQDFLDNLNWEVESLVDNDFEDINISLIKGYLKYPIEEVTGVYGNTSLGLNGSEFKGIIGDFKALEVQYNTLEESYSSLVVLDERQQKQLLEFLIGDKLSRTISLMEAYKQLNRELLSTIQTENKELFDSIIAQIDGQD